MTKQDTLVAHFDDYNKNVHGGKATQGTFKDFFCGAVVAHALIKDGKDIRGEINGFRDLMEQMALLERLAEVLKKEA